MEYAGEHSRSAGYLSTGRVILARDLAARFGTSERTIRRDISQLRDEGYRIDSAPGIGGGYRALSGAVLAPLQFSANEVCTLAMALRALGGQGMRDAEAATHREHVHHVETTMHRVRSVLPSDILAILLSAVAKCRLVDLEYSGGTHDSQRRVELYRIVVLGAHWYLFAWDLLRGTGDPFASIGPLRFTPPRLFLNTGHHPMLWHSFCTWDINSQW